MMLRAILILVSLLNMMLVSPIRLSAWQMNGSDLQRISLPADLQAVPLHLECDFDLDGQAERLVMNKGRLLIQSRGQIDWSSPENWQVQQALISDLNHDGKPEAVLLVSRPFSAWPVDAWLPNGGRIETFHDAQGRSSHIILIGWDGSRFREVWAGSALAEPVASMAVAALDENGPYLVTLEKNYDDPPNLPARRLKIWTWNGFGFSSVSALDGRFTRLTVAESGNRQVVVLQ